MSATTFWLVLMIIFIVIEAATVGLASIWFAIGALAALISAYFGAVMWLQIVWFLVISAVTLYFTRPLATKYINAKKEATNADRVIGSSAVVTEIIDNLAGTGSVSVGGKFWTARSEDGGVIPSGAFVTVGSIEGVKLIVAAQAQAAE